MSASVNPNDNLKIQKPASIALSGRNDSLENGPNDDGKLTDYVNASYINTVLQKKLIIAASAPNKTTVTDFLQMIIENNITLIMKLCDFKDKSGKD